MKEETIFKAYKEWTNKKVCKDESLIVLEFLDDIFGVENFTKKYVKWCKKKEKGRVPERSKGLGS